ncbi:hypothetical protein G6M70_04680 [Agrobacterium tumefaciens]|uniref:SIR2 family protein n=1 Tax=Agrobacterium tumefaciens TaxID=358 RepID=UPI001571EC8D|nr:SIR2 family protein [Agrobacterium tumefaciens]NSZ03128.1 hypothetical protein [Agrobacterium tumefaciens]NSZ39743.1 hypothetical protein [Agrobacterium tumefaciens]NTB26701.1 hypothetical protein [Agrobacterium tumefaciens]NTB29934.1 hypothetical protein [Agrobacterium tumefaciens]NTB34350.1 hypothetical protein [Agrobacterium tumefaciens]
MKFIENSSDVPDELIDAVLAGDVVFLCGAGVSKGADLPLFDALTDKIYEDLGETFENDPAERESYKKAEFDRTLRALEKRVRRPGSPRSPVRASCAKHLQVPAGQKFPHHEAVLALSRDREGRSRVLTTNFDTLFERALVDRDEEVFSEAMKSLPKPGGPHDFGIHHLHGRIADPVLKLAESELILTSADFGDAYLRDGWASRYVEDRMRTATLVLLGYRAEDAALRLLLETLDVDRERFPDLKKVYALERQTSDSAGQWRAKGVTPVEFASHEALYETLSAWAIYAERPVEFEREVMTRVLKKSPDQASDFDRSQLSSLKARGNAPALLIEANPSLAWLPTLIEIKMIQFDDRWLAAWINQNFQEPRSVREVVAHLGMFGPGVADALSYLLERYKGELSILLRKSWSLLVRHMRRVRLSPASGWYDLLPVLERSDSSPETIARLAELLKPELRVSRRFTLDDEPQEDPASVHDLMRVEFEPEEDLALDEVLDAWSKEMPGEVDASLLVSLTHALDSAVEEVIDLGLDGERGSGLIDIHVASVGDHPQNRHRKGFLPIVRVIAEVWLRLADKMPERASNFVTSWIRSTHRINHRLALFACRHPSIGADMINEVIQLLPDGEIFVTGSAVEAHRLLVERWKDLDLGARERIEQRLRHGLPADWFNQDADVTKYMDRSRYDVIGNLLRDGVDLSDSTIAEYEAIIGRHPEWRLRPQAQSGFHRWFEMSSEQSVSDPQSFKDVSDDALLETALRQDARDRWQDGRSWRHLCEQESDRAFRALQADTSAGRWHVSAWRDFLQANAKESSAIDVPQIADHLLKWPIESLSEIADYAVDWLGCQKVLETSPYRWDVWDKIADTLVDDGTPTPSAEQIVQDSFGHKIGKLTDIVIQRIADSEDHSEDTFVLRLESLIERPGNLGRLAKVRLAINLGYMFERAQDWVIEKLVPLFDWSDPDAAAVWQARLYSRFIGGPKLFALVKPAFLQLFLRPDVSDEALREFSGWLVSMLLANIKSNAGYDLSFVEARAALRRTRPMVLQSVAHDLAEEMQRAAPSEKLVVWKNIIGPVFEGIWPMDVDLLSGTVTFKLLQILRATGEAFPHAASVIEPFIVPEEKEQGTAAYSLGNADDILFSLAPSKMLDIVTAVVGSRPPGSVFELRSVLERISACDPALINTRKYQALSQMAR